ncbi:tRNA (adenosine(37)-N6)-threonylcarbamoyltransferase complex transferase subunit TsaD [Candidatus Poribacteria bacterium]|nr:tRNA (adenosine(37)-N6)-threonylcarbamoyltransferase complex transferase subunit TsaD [Candidatus Poribacteria bacterium]
MIVLGIETSCDETAAAVVEDGKLVLSNVVASQVDVHSIYGGVVPELASRKHIQNIVPVMTQALNDAGINLDDVDGIAVTQGPGLVGSLLIGISVAKAIAYTRDIPIVGVNHLEGHIYANYLEYDELDPPFVILVVSGGHTDLVYVGSRDRHYEKLGQTLDDAAGEAFDKVAKLLELGYPGGPVIDRMAKDGNPEAVDFPRPVLHDHSLNFSFSGLKTAVLNYVTKELEQGNSINKADVVASFQAAVVDVLVEKTIRAAEMKSVNTVALGGGVAANSMLREQLAERCKKEGYKLFYPSKIIMCTDNAAMIAGIGYFILKDGENSELSLSTDAFKRSVGEHGYKVKGSK